MDNTALQQGYDHARNAITFKEKGSLNAARESHEQAAGRFSSASDTTEDYEATRLLALLQEHHSQLAKAISGSQSVKSSSKDKNIEAEKDPDTIERQDEPSTLEKVKSPAHSVKSNPALATAGLRTPRRDLTSSIASNLATARGRPPSQKRASPLPPDVTAQHVPGKVVTRPAGRPSAQTIPSHQTPPTRASQATTVTTEAFSTFYNSLQGLYNRLPASLAFTGLPLTIEEEPELAEPVKKASSSKSPRKPPRATAETDFSSIFSPNVIAALREDAGVPFGAHESFYVVPPTGGTQTYSAMVSGERGLAGSEDPDEFVDAREHVGPPSPVSVRSSQNISRARGKKAADIAARRSSQSGKTTEELELENDALREILDTQSKRLSMWETSAQSQSMALAQSMRLTRNPTSSVGSGEHVPENQKLKELEDELVALRSVVGTLEHRNDKLERDKEKLLKVIAKYREKWDRLKESARQRERNKSAADGV